MKVAFILGSGHCGSTLLDLILDSHPSIVGVGEMHVATHEMVCTCGQRADLCVFWRAVLGDGVWPDREVYRSKFDFLLGTSGPYRYVRTREVADTALLTADILAAYSRALQAGHGSILVDSSKSPERAELLMKNSSVEAVVIHLVRDGRAVTWSYVRKYGRVFPFFFTWALSNLKVEFLRLRWAGKYCLVRYEDLVARPAQELERICTTVGIDYNQSMLDFRAQAHHEIGGNRMRLTPETTIRPDDKWRADMPYWMQILFTICFWWLQRRYAY